MSVRRGSIRAPVRALRSSADSLRSVRSCVPPLDRRRPSGLANGQPFPSLGPRDNPGANPDGSIDLYYGPTAPAGKEKSWRRTVPGKGFFAILRLYGPTEAAFNQSWIPGDIERVK
jgi:hypothetical protein